jgi:predicted permease
VLLFTAAVSIAIGLIFALAPLRGMARISLALGMKNSAATSNRDRGKIRGGQVVIALQTALCLTLLVGAGLLVRTLRNLETKNLGLRTPGLLVFGITPPQSIRSDADGVHFYQTLLDRIRNVPRVQGATVLLERIGAGGSWNTGGIRVDGADPNNERHAGMRWNAVGPDSLRILGIPILRGRDFTEADSANSQQVAVVDQAFADRYLPGVDPIGHRIGTGGNLGRKDHTIVGVAANSNYTHVRDKGKPTGYFPYTQVRGISTMNVELRTTGDPITTLPEVRRAIREVSPDLLPLQPKTQQQVFETESSFQMGRLLARLSAFFGLLAAVLVATGLYGTLAYAVNRRTTEVGVRMALGAKRGQVLWMILRQSLNVTLIGIALGLPLALFASRSLRSMLFGLAPTDPATFAAALGGLILVAAVASFIPARRAASVDPIVALRNE